MSAAPWMHTYDRSLSAIVTTPNLLLAGPATGPLAFFPGRDGYLVTATRVDGTSVTVIAENYGENSVPMVKNPPPTKPQRTGTPLTEAQLVKIALAPALAY